MPALDETYLTQGQQSYLITKSAQTALSAGNCRQLDEAQIATTSPEAFTTEGLDKFNRLGKACRFTHYGGDCYNYALLAAGHLDLVMEHQLATHDFMALIPVLKGAGAVVTDWFGQPPNLFSDGSLLAAATPELHKAALAEIS
jgi:fructose-1,6-bisphosphatase/inositol monophosphatase family enzyme